MIEMSSTDFWWLSPGEARSYRHVNLFHQEPYSDEPNTNRDPLSCPMLPSDKRYVLELVSKWKKKFKNINVFRSFALYSSDTNGEELIGPFLLDIDRVNQKDGGSQPQLDEALQDTRRLIKEYCSRLKPEDYRIFFTGHKGFHIEVSPGAINSPMADCWRHFENTRKDINNHFGADFIDVFHSHVRLHNSINSWIDYSGQPVCRMTFEVSTNEIFSLCAEDISTKGAKLALQTLNSQKATSTNTDCLNVTEH